MRRSTIGFVCVFGGSLSANILEEEKLRALGIRVVIGAAAETPEKVVAAFIEGKLVVGENICDH